MDVDIVGMFEQLASTGTPPADGCHLFGVGYESAFEQLERRFIVDRFNRGGSAEKFVVGPFGSGKTHFLRELMEIARARDCVTAEVALSKNLDFVQSLVVYQEIVRGLRIPGSDVHGIKGLLRDSVARRRAQGKQAGLSDEMADELVKAWGVGLREQEFESLEFGRVLAVAVESERVGNLDQFEAAARWLGGEMRDTAIARAIGESPLSAAELKVQSQRARLSLFQFIRYAGYQGTVLCFDEAEQGMSVDRKRMATIFSQLLSEINAISTLRGGSALVIYALTSDVIEKIVVQMPMLAQRLNDPGPGQGFFDGNVLAPKIDLTQRLDPVLDLTRIGERLADVFSKKINSSQASSIVLASEIIPGMAAEVAAEEASSSARRTMVKRVCSKLMNSYYDASGSERPAPKPESAEAEV